MTSLQVAFLGPEGAYAHIVSRQRYPSGVSLVPRPSIPEVFEYVEAVPDALGIVPIENSSGGTIVATVDRLIDPRCKLVITEALTLDVRLALLGHDIAKIKRVYSHFAPFSHCDTWLKVHLPGVAREEVNSTGEAARLAGADKTKTSAALASRANAKLYGLKVLQYPVEQDVPNVTQFVTIARPKEPSPENNKTSLVVNLENRPGALSDFIVPLSAGGINLTRIVSRPVHGEPNTYTFFIEIDGTKQDPKIASALSKASRKAASVRAVGEYRVADHYES